MDAIDARNLATMMFALIGAGACFAYVLTDQRRKAQKPIYAIAGFGFLYAIIIYAAGVFSINPVYLLRSGWLGAIAFYILTVAYIAVIIVNWRTNDRR